MRKIKFRAWENTGITLFRNEAGQMLMPDDYGRQIRLPCGDYKDKNVTWMQFTGKEDKNGKEIYEGDLVGYGSSSRIWKVEFRDGCWKTNEIPCDEKNEPANRYELYGWDIPCEVIGNIHENPELLNG